MGINELVEISNFYGVNPDYVLAGGGNTSFKDNEYLYVKGSGTTLATITEDGFVKMSRKKLSDMWNKNYPEQTEEREARVLEDLMDARDKSCINKRPSVETSLHDIFPQAYVVHLHPSLINGLTCSKNGERTAKELWGDECVWIPETEPGWTLAKLVRERFDENKRLTGNYPSILFLENHGIFVAADNTEDIKKTYSSVFARLNEKLKRKINQDETDFDKERAAYLAPCIRMLLMCGETSIVTVHNDVDIMSFIHDRASFEPLSSAYTPDHIVYYKPYPLFVEQKKDLEEQQNLIKTEIQKYIEKYGYAPKIIAVEKLCVFAHGNTKKNADIAMQLFRDAAKIAVYSKSFGGHKFMCGSLIDFIVNWEVESYRSKVGQSGNIKRLNEKVIIVTGAAQGFGQGIAESLLENGCNMVIADLNKELAEKNACEYSVKFGKGKALAVKVDVSDENDVLNMAVSAVMEYGGIDMMVSNAGIARSGNIEQMTSQIFELHTKINYTGYFLCSKFVSRIMKIQNRFKPDYYMDIVQVNSKSGLEGSNKNFAYAGSKFGGIGLTQSFALELVEYNIKVNSVCPGNFLDGPLWSDPEKGLFVQYLNSGKVPGAKNVDDVRKFYESKVPMSRGCLPSDVAVAIMYCAEQKYETGQAIPVSGGQVMLK